jgi:Ca-activated chloride channel homolog
MASTDVKPSRLAAAEAAARALVGRLPQPVRVRVVAFSSEPELLTPPTADRRLVRAAIGRLHAGGPTAIGDGLAAALRVGERAVGADPRGALSIVLLSDGHQSSGTLQPLQAAQRARQARVPVYTVALGSRARLLKGEPYTVAPPDAPTLRAIAIRTGGRFTAAADPATLRSAYTRLGQRLGHTQRNEEVSSLFLGASAVFLVGAGVLGTLWSPRLP